LPINSNSQYNAVDIYAG